MNLFLVFAFAFFGNLGPHPLWAQASLSNDDVPQLVKTGLSEELILKLIDQHGSNLSGDASHLIELKNNGVSECIIGAIATEPAGKSAHQLCTDSARESTASAKDFCSIWSTSYPGNCYGYARSSSR